MKETTRDTDTQRPSSLGSSLLPYLTGSQYQGPEWVSLLFSVFVYTNKVDLPDLQVSIHRLNQIWMENLGKIKLNQY